MIPALLVSLLVGQTAVYVADPSARPAANMTGTQIGAKHGLDVNIIGGNVVVVLDGGVTLTGPIQVNQNLSRDGGFDWSVVAKLVAADGTAIGTAGAPIRVDPTGTTPQPVTGTFFQATQPVSGPLTDAQLRATAVPVSGTVAATQGTSPWVTSATQSGAWNVGQTGTWTVQPGNTANTTPWLATISQGGNSATVSAAGALKVDGSAVTQPVSGTVAVSGTVTTTNASVGATGAAVPASATQIGASDGTNLVAPRSYDTDTGAGTQNTLGVSLRVGASGGSSEAAAGAGTTSASTLRVVLPTDQTSIPAAQSGTWNVNNVSGTVSLPTGASTAANQTTLGSQTTKVNDGTDTLLISAAGAALVDGSAVTQPISAASLPLPTGAATSANQTTVGSQTTKINDGTDTALVSGTGSLQVTCDNCGGSTFADNAAFTFGTTNIGLNGYVFDDVAPNTVTENSAATPRMSSKRVPYAMLRDAAGNERGANVTASNALVVDGSAVTQPVSLTSTTITGTVAVTQSTSPWVTSNANIDVALSTRLAEATFTGRWPAAGALSDNFANPTTTQVGAFTLLWDGATWDRAPGNSTDGMLVNLGANNDVTVTSGTVTANQGTPNSTANRWPVQMTDGTDLALVTAAGAQNMDTSSIAGTTTAVNYGAGSAGTQRVAVAGPADNTTISSERGLLAMGQDVNSSAHNIRVDTGGNLFTVARSFTQQVFNNSTISASGTDETDFLGYGNTILIVNVTGAVTGDGARLFMQMQDVDPFNAATLIGNVTVCPVLSASTLTMTCQHQSHSTRIRITYSVSTGASFGGVYGGYIGPNGPSIAPSADNSENVAVKTPVLAARSNFVQPYWTEGYQTPLSVDQNGYLRTDSSSRLDTLNSLMQKMVQQNATILLLLQDIKSPGRNLINEANSYGDISR